MADQGRTRALDRYLGSDEVIMLETRQHPFAVLASFLQAVFTLIPLGMVMWGIHGLDPFRNQVGDWIIRVLLLGMVLVVVRLAWHVLDWEHARLVITSEKVIHVRGILQRRIASTPLVKVSELTVIQPLLGRFFGYGKLVVDAPGGGAQPLHGLEYIPEPVEVYRVIDEVARRGRAFEGGARPGADETAIVEYDPDEPHGDDNGDTVVIRGN